jgi:hypothetical protein
MAPLISVISARVDEGLMALMDMHALDHRLARVGR